VGGRDPGFGAGFLPFRVDAEIAPSSLAANSGAGAGTGSDLPVGKAAFRATDISSLTPLARPADAAKRMECQASMRPRTSWALPSIAGNITGANTASEADDRTELAIDLAARAVNELKL
jgi:hypothetical protein